MTVVSVTMAPTVSTDPDLPDAPPSVRVELRCPEPVVKDRCTCGHAWCASRHRTCPLGGTRSAACHPGKLFAVLEQGEAPAFIQPDNLVVLACLDCKRSRRAQGRHDVVRVLHCYDFVGHLVKTMEEVSSGPDGSIERTAG